MPRCINNSKKLKNYWINKFLIFLLVLILFISSINFTVISYSELPDLKIKSFNSPSEATEGDNITVNVTVQNIGGNISEGVNVDIGLFIDEDYSSPVSVNSTDEGISTDNSTYFHLFWTAELGDHSLTAWVDYSGNIGEPNEVNNMRINFITVNAGPPKLKIDQFSIPDNIEVNSTVTIKVGVKNVGSDTSEKITARLKIKQDNYNEIKEKSNGLNRGEIYNFSFEWTPDVFGDYTFNTTIKLDDDIQDQDERNRDIIPYRLNWWNQNWHYRKLIGVYGSGNTSISFNFTKLLHELNIFSKTFENDTIRIVEYSNKGEIIKEITFFEFLENNDYNENTNANGTLIWRVSSEQGNPVTKFFYVYFDVKENKGIRTSIDEVENIVTSIFDVIYSPKLEGWWDVIVNPQNDGYSSVQDPLIIEVTTIALAEKVTAYLKYKSNLQATIELSSDDGSFLNWSGSYNIPSGKIGNWEIKINTSDEAEFYNNNSKNNFYVGKPDVAVCKITYSPTRVYDDDLIVISAELRSYNITIKDVDILLRIKNSDGQTVLSEENLITIPKDEKKVYNFTWDPIERGKYLIEISLDELKVFTESNEENNKKSINIRVYGIPNLGVVDIIVPSEDIEEGKSVNIRAILNNTGRGVAEDYNVRLYLSQGNMNWLDNQIKDSTNITIGINKTKEINLTWNPAIYGAPGFLGKWYVGVFIYYNSTYKDLNILNNSKFSSLKIVPGEKNPPYIKIIEKSEGLQVGSTVNIVAQVTDTSGIKFVNISITNPQKTTITEEMVPEDDNQYSFDFKNTSIIGKYEFKITAIDNSFYESKRSLTDYFTITADTTPPTIEYFGAHPSVQLEGNNVEISCITKDFNGVKSVKTTITFPDNHTETKFLNHVNNGKYIFNSNYGILGKYSFRVSSEDNSKNIGFSGEKEFWITNDLDDIDGDGMPNSWEERYGFNPKNPNDAKTDNDDDGYTNLEEYENGDNPIKAQSSIKEIISKIEDNWTYLVVSVVLFSFIILISIYGIRRLKYENIQK